MPKLFDRVKVNIPTTGTGTVTFGAVPSNAFLTPAESGAIDSDTVRYLLIEGTDFEEGVGTIQSSIAQMARTTVTRSKIAGVYGSSKINLSGTATLVFTASAADILNPANSLSDVASVATARTNLGATATGVALFTANNAAAGRAALGSTTVGDAVFVASDAATARAAMETAPFFAADSSVININGGMEVSQENVGNAVTLTGSGTLQFKHLLDGAVAGYRGTFVASAQQVAAPSGMPAVKALKITVGTAQGSLGANDELTLMFPVEGYRASRLLFGTSSASALGLGFWFSAHRTGSYSGAIMNSAKTRSYPFSFSVAAADTPQWVSLSGASAIAGDTSGTWLKDTGVGLYVAICLAGGTSRVGSASAWATTSSPGSVGVTGTTNGVAATSDVFHISNVIALPGIELPAGARAPLAIRSAEVGFFGVVG